MALSLWAIAGPALACSQFTQFMGWPIGVTEPNVIFWQDAGTLSPFIDFSGCRESRYLFYVEMEMAGMTYKGKVDGYRAYEHPSAPGALFFARARNGTDIAGWQKLVEAEIGTAGFIKVKYQMGVMLQHYVPTQTTVAEGNFFKAFRDSSTPIHGRGPVRFGFTNQMPTPTCTLSDKSLRIALDPVQAQDVPSGQKSYSKSQTLQFRNCGITRTIDLTFSGTPDPVDGELYKNTAADPAGGIGIALQRQGASDWLQNGKRQTLAIANQQADFTFDASYYSSRWLGAVTPGNVAANIVINLDYK